MRVLLLVLFCSTCALAQTPEVRGVIVETGTTTPIPGVEVSLSEFGPNADNFIVSKTVATATTDGNGAFSLRPGHGGNFTFTAAKPSYRTVTGRMLSLTADRPSQSITASLTRPGTLIGRVVDEAGNPVPNLRLMVEGLPARTSEGLPIGRFPGDISVPVITNAEGGFTASDLLPGSFRVHVPPRGAPGVDALLPFTETAFQIVDVDVEPAYYPGGLAEPEQVVPISVAGGGTANAGTLTVRRVPYYRLRLTLNRECTPNERWTFRLRPVGVLLGPFMDYWADCRQDALLTGIAPGEYDLAIWNGRGYERWSRSRVVMTKENVAVAIAFTESASVSGRLVAADGEDLTKLGPVSVIIRSLDSLPGPSPEASNAAGNFTFDHVPWDVQWLSVLTRDPGTYVKEIRYDGLPLRGPKLNPAPGSTIEAVLSSQAAQLSVTVKRGEAPVAGAAVLLVSTSITEPPPILTALPPFILGGGIGDGAIPNVPPGDYRLVVLDAFSGEDLSDPNEIAQLLARAQRVTLARGENKSIEVQLR